MCSCSTTPTCWTPPFWQEHKERIQAGHLLDVFPYHQERRFVHTPRLSHGQPLPLPHFLCP